MDFRTDLVRDLNQCDQHPDEKVECIRQTRHCSGTMSEHFVEGDGKNGKSADEIDGFDVGRELVAFFGLVHSGHGFFFDCLFLDLMSICRSE